MAEEIVGARLVVEGGDAMKTVGQFRRELDAAQESARLIGEAFGKNSPEFKAAQEQVTQVKDQLSVAAQSALKLGDNVTKSTTSMKAQLRAAVENLIQVQQEFGDISPQAQEAAKAVAELRDRIKDAREVSDLFDPEKKFQAVLGVAQGIASGFAAVQGAMALIGSESEDVEKALLKVQSAMALAQGLSGVVAAVEDFKRLGAIIKSTTVVQKAFTAVNVLATYAMRALGIATDVTVTSVQALKAALVSTGLGAIVVLIGTAVYQLMQLTDATDEQTEAQRKLNTETRDYANAVSDAITEGYEKEAQIAVARAKATGKSAKEIEDIQRESLQKIQRERAANLQHQKDDLLDFSDAKKKSEKADTDLTLFELGVQQKAREDAVAAQKAADEKANQEHAKRLAERVASVKAAADLEKQVQGEIFAATHTAEETELRELADKFAQRKLIYTKAGKDITDLLVAQALERGQIEKKYADERAAAQAEEDAGRLEQSTAYLESLGVLFDDFNARDKARQEAQRQIDEASLEHKRAMAGAAANILNGLSSLAGENTAAGKALAITGATIATYAAAQQAYWAAFTPVPTPQSPVLGVLYAAAAVATGLANIKRIAAVQVPGQGGGSSVPSISNTAPLAPNRPQTSTVSIDQNSINQMGSALPMRAYVVEADISKSQARMDRILQAAKFE